MLRRRRLPEHPHPPPPSLLISLSFLLCSPYLQITAVSASTDPGSVASDRAALLRFKAAVVSDPSALLSAWSDSPASNHCTWPGITCDSRSRVRALNVSVGLQPICQTPSRQGTCPGLVGSLSPAIGDLLQLRVLAIPHHELAGDLPLQVASLDSLEVLDLRGNSLSGPLPSRFATSLRVLNLGSNRFTGEIPTSLSSCTALEVLDLAHNLLNGTVPSFFPGLRELKELRLGFNRLGGVIPPEIGGFCCCARLKTLDLSRNLLVGGVPPGLGNCTSLRSLMLYSNRLEGGIPDSLTGLSRLGHLSLADNHLTDTIPVRSGDWKSLQLLDLSSNSLYGEIPADLSALTNLSVLLLDSNNLSGPIPTSVATMPSLTRFNASFNNLSGTVPLNPIVRPDTLLGNPLLHLTDAFPHPSLLMPADDPALGRRFLQDTAPPDANNHNTTASSKGFSAVEIASITSASAIVSVLLALIVIYIYTRKCSRRSAVESSGRRDVTIFREPGVRLTYEIVIRATGNFNASNCIGSGGFGATYRAEVAPGVLVAIKRLSAGRFSGLRQFHAEVKTLGRVQQSNLVTLYGYHVSESETFLIYNYLPGGNLENFIRKRSRRPVQWRMLHKIALDVAHALAYLHEVCVPRILHRDVKPSNILLDNDYNAYLSDFGLARLLGNSETHATTNVEGTFGYVAPEYAMTCRVSDRADVYSYGVVLLELISDKKALDPSFSPYANGFNIVQWARMLLEKGRAREFFFEGLWDVGPHDDLVEILRLAITCSDDTLTRRPKMKEVVQRLKQLQPPTY